MEYVIILLVIVAVLFLIIKSGEAKLKSIDPSTLSMEQLRMHQGMCRKKLRAVHNAIAQAPIEVGKPNSYYDQLCEKAEKYEAQCKPIEEEIKRRLIEEEKCSKLESHEKGSNSATQGQADTLRAEARKGFEDGWAIAKKRGNGERECIQIALTVALYSQVTKFTQVSEDVTEQLTIELMPFNQLDRDAAKQAITEYIVWREFPEFANVDVVKNAVKSFGKEAFNEVFGNNSEIGKAQPWSTLLE